MQRAFSLVELSIVLVILGLLTGGILAGQSLIRAAELRAAGSEYQRFTASIHAFRDKYMSIPGDMTNATRFWGRTANVASCVTTSGAAITAPGTCDGDGDGILEVAGAASQSAEIFQFYNQLAQAGLIEGSYSGYAGSGGVSDAAMGINIPPSKLTNAGWSATYLGVFAGSATIFAGDFGNLFYLGAKETTSLTANPAFEPEELWNIDTKFDDGKPGAGKVVLRGRNTCSDSTSATDYASDYLLSSTAIACTAMFRKVF